MSIETEYHSIYLVCNICGDSVQCESWNDAVEYRKAAGWTRQKESGNWIDVCPDCGELE